MAGFALCRRIHFVGDCIAHEVSRLRTVVVAGMGVFVSSALTEGRSMLLYCWR